MGECQCKRRETGRKTRAFLFFCTFVVSCVSLTFFLSDLSYIVSAFFWRERGFCVHSLSFFFFVIDL